MSTVEVNFDGLVGPTHNYAGLSFGNLASARNRDAIARPREAALQGLAKMRRLMALGLRQGVLAPPWRPNIPWLRTLGFAGSDAEVWAHANAADPALVRFALSASAMWAANAATVSPAADTGDGRLHLSVANLVTMAHRAQEAPETLRLLQRIFPDARQVAVHEALPAQAAFADEGAANHMRLCAGHGAPGLEVFVYGRGAEEVGAGGFPARQTLEACQAVARRHRLDPARTIFARQSAQAIAAGAFHNDVVAVAHETALFYHEHAFADAAGLRAEIMRKAEGLFTPQFVEAPEAEVPLAEAVSSYLFNSQLVRLPEAARLTLIAPQEVAETPSTRHYVERLIAGDSPIGGLEVVGVRESMRNGGGPACLRLRVAASEAVLAGAAGFLITPALADRLEAWVTAHYRETLGPEDFADARLIEEAATALDALTDILPLGDRFYPFQS